jgi:galactonate dehydratase
MKITSVKTIVVNARLRNWIFVRVETDVSGLVGLVEATSNSRPAPSLALSRISLRW